MYIGVYGKAGGKWRGCIHTHTHKIVGSRVRHELPRSFHILQVEDVTFYCTQNTYTSIIKFDIRSQATCSTICAQYVVHTGGST